MTHIDTHISFLCAVAALDRFAVTGPRAKYDEVQRAIREGNRARRQGNLEAASRAFLAALDA